MDWHFYSVFLQYTIFYFPTDTLRALHRIQAPFNHFPSKISLFHVNFEELLVGVFCYQWLKSSKCQLSVVRLILIVIKK